MLKKCLNTFTLYNPTLQPINKFHTASIRHCFVEINVILWVVNFNIVGGELSPVPNWKRVVEGQGFKNRAGMFP